MLRARLGADIALQGLAYGEAVVLNGVRVSLHPAGHVLGSAQVRVEHRGRVWVASGDYFVSGIDHDVNATCAPFEPVRCHCFITESTFGLPIYRWRAQAAVQREINAWWQANAQAGRASLLLGYSFGKAQRLLAGLDPSIGPIVAHGAVETLNAAYRAAGVTLPPTRRIDELPRAELKRAHRAGAARGAGQRVGTPARRRCERCFCQRLDAAARRAPPPGRGPRLRAQRPCRLARPAARDRRHRRRARDRHSRLRGGDGALAAAAGPAGAELCHRVRRRRDRGRRRRSRRHGIDDT